MLSEDFIARRRIAANDRTRNQRANPFGTKGSGGEPRDMGQKVGELKSPERSAPCRRFVPVGGV
jgi:hypothetical protein